jgi:hypothetical protein
MIHHMLFVVVQSHTEGIDMLHMELFGRKVQWG